MSINSVPDVPGAETPSPLTVLNAPVGTRAPSISGGHWYRDERGWVWNGPTGNGGVFPTPGGDWNGTLLPPRLSHPDVAPVLKSLNRRWVSPCGGFELDTGRVRALINALVAGGDEDRFLRLPSNLTHEPDLVHVNRELSAQLEVAHAEMRALLKSMSQLEAVQPIGAAGLNRSAADKG